MYVDVIPNRGSPPAILLRESYREIDKLKQRFHLQRVVMVGDRGLLTSARIEQTRC